MIVEQKNDKHEENNFKEISYLKQLRNNLVGSSSNKLLHINNGLLEKLLKEFYEMKDYANTDLLKIIFSIINSFVITHSEQLNNILNHKISLTQITIKILLSNLNNCTDISFFESGMRLLKNMAQEEKYCLFSIEHCFSSGLIAKIHDLLLSDVLFQYVSVIIGKFCESSYYKQTVFRNEKLINDLILKFYENKNTPLGSYLLEIIHHLSEEDVNICKILYKKNIMELLINYIRYYDNNSKIYAISMMVNIYTLLNLQFDNEKHFSWFINLLISILKEEVSNKIKIKIVQIISAILKPSQNLQNSFFNLSGIEEIIKQFKQCFDDNKIKEVEEIVKIWKSKKEYKKSLLNGLSHTNTNTNTNTANTNTPMDIQCEYKCFIIECLVIATSEKEEIRKKVIDSKELFLFVYLLISFEDQHPKLVLSTANLILSLSRSNTISKNIFKEFDITDILLKISNHCNIDIQISVTSSVCNFLLDDKKEKEAANDCVGKLLNIFSQAKHMKIRKNVIFAIKNIIYSIKNQKEFKKAIMKKITFDFIAELCNDEDFEIQVQALYIFRILLGNASTEELDEILTQCKSKLLKILESKLEFINIDIVCHCLYILCIFAGGNTNHKKILLENGFLKKVAELLNTIDVKIRQVCVSIISNFVENNNEEEFDSKKYLAEYGISEKLSKMVNIDENYEFSTTISKILNHNLVKTKK